MGAKRPESLVVYISRVSLDILLYAINMQTRMKYIHAISKLSTQKNNFFN